MRFILIFYLLVFIIVGIYFKILIENIHYSHKIEEIANILCLEKLNNKSIVVVEKEDYGFRCFCFIKNKNNLRVKKNVGLILTKEIDERIRVENVK